MTIGLISDVHGNLAALEAVLADIDRAGISRIWCLGDTLGYGPHPSACLERIAERCEVVLAGNHDLAVRGDIDARMFGGSAGAGVLYSRATLTPAAGKVLASLRAFAFCNEAELYHASANDWVWEYVRDEPVATRHLQTQRLPLSCVGHSHEQVSFHLAPEAAQACSARMQDEARIIIGAGKYVVNPGSVGQPRDGDPRAAWASLVPGSHVDLHRTAYDIEATQAAITAAGLPEQLALRLARGH